MREPGNPSSASAPIGQPASGPGYQPGAEFQPDREATWPDWPDWADDAADDKRTPLTGILVREPGRSEPVHERGTGRTVRAEWALWGKEPRDTEYSVLRCSKGAFGPGDFQGVITRYTPGTKDALPQYTVCWIPDENGHEGYLAVAIHELADANPRRSGGRVRAAGGREIEYIRLFCVRYSEMAEQQVSYAELVESVMDRQLPADLTELITVELLEPDVPPFPRAVRALAENVATLLLTVRPVCVLGAERVSAEERLRFIDQVMSLLPYGMRAAMSASTWASATARNLKLRLFFSSAERDDGGATAHMIWGQPVRFELSAPESTQLRHYVNWLKHDGAGAAVDLAGQMDPVRFDADEIRQMIADLPRDRPVRDVLEELADGVRHGQLPIIRSAVKRLKERLNSPLSAEERERYREEIKRLGLFSDHPGLHHQTAESVYRVLLGLAFGDWLSYVSYCRIEDYAGGPPRGALGREMLKLKFSTYLPWLLTMKSAAKLTDQDLLASLHQQGINATVPIEEFCRHTGAVRPVHRPVGYDFAVQHLRAYAKDPRAELVLRGYLAETLETVFPHDQQQQRIRLKHTLVFVHGRMLTEEESAELLSRPDLRRTLAFDAAVAELTVRPARNDSRGPLALLKSPNVLWKRGRDAKVPLVNAATVVLGLLVIVLAVALILMALLFQHG
jgi:hypothetical protein